MARTKFRVEVLTPEGEVFNDEVEMVSTRTTVGSIGVLANHTPVLAWGAETAAQNGLQGTGALGPVDGFGLEALIRGVAEAGISRA